MDRAETLIQAHFDGLLSPEEERELAALLDASAEARHLMASYMRLEGAHTQLAQSGLLEAPTPARRSSGRSRARLRSTSGAPYWIVGLLAAGIFIGLTILLATTSPEPVRPRIARPAPPRPVQPKPKPAPPIAPQPEPPKPVPAPPSPSKDPAKRDAELKRTAPEPPKNQPKPAPVPPPPSPKPKPPATVVAVATFDGKPLLQGAVVAGPGAAVLSDGTTITLAPAARLRADAARTYFLLEGALDADVRPQKPGQPLVLSTPHGVATVLGTQLRLTVEPDATRLEVTEGKVRLQRARSSVVVAAGHFALAAPGKALKARPLALLTEAVRLLDRNGVVTINFGPPDTPAAAGSMLDSGEPFDAKRGFGWTGPRVGKPLPGIVHRGRQILAGRDTARRPGSDPLRTTHVAAGWKDHVETWTMRLPDGVYLIDACAGDASNPEGPHHVRMNGRTIIDTKVTGGGEFAEATGVPVRVVGGTLTMTVGGHGSDVTEEDGSSDTFLNFIRIRKAPR